MKIEIHYTAKGTIGLEIGRRRRRRRRVHCKLESLVQGYDNYVGGDGDGGGGGQSRTIRDHSTLMVGDQANDRGQCRRSDIVVGCWIADLSPLCCDKMVKKK
ncbi:hypothetical protein BLOT_016526 [Blomia tropicalis]|nr:hypothetical protein BLOT_016526 [Blomia tropicalis]